METGGESHFNLPKTLFYSGTQKLQNAGDTVQVRSMSALHERMKLMMMMTTRGNVCIIITFVRTEHRAAGREKALTGVLLGILTVLVFFFVCVLALVLLFFSLRAFLRALAARSGYYL